MKTKLNYRLADCCSLGQQYSIIIEKIAAKFSWMRKPIYLFHRFKKIHSCENNLSVREIKMLRQILMKSNYSEIDYDSVMFHFPGKKLSMIKNKTQSILKSLNIFH